MTEHTFTIYTDNHIFTVGDVEYELEPEVDTPTILAAMATLARKNRERRAARKTDEPATEVTADDDPADPSKLTPIELMAQDAEESTADLREFIASLMIPASAEKFATNKYPDRVLLQMQNAALEVYGLRPTTSSNGSSAPSATTPTPGNASTDNSPSEESTP